MTLTCFKTSEMMRLVGSESFRAVSLHHHARIHHTSKGSSEEAEHAAIRVSVQVACIVKVKRGSLSIVLICFVEVLHTGTVMVR